VTSSGSVEVVQIATTAPLETRRRLGMVLPVSGGARLVVRKETHASNQRQCGHLAADLRSLDSYRRDGWVQY